MVTGVAIGIPGFLILLSASALCYRRKMRALQRQLLLEEHKQRHKPMSVQISGAIDCVSVEMRSYLIDVAAQLGIADQPGKAQESKFSSTQEELVFGRPKESALGVVHFMRTTADEVRSGMQRGVSEIKAEFDNFLHHAQQRESSEDDAWWESLDIAKEAHECMQYCLCSAAGSSAKTFENSDFPRDCDAYGVRTDRKRPDGTGMMLADFCELPQIRETELSPAHVAAIRIYTTAAYKVINGPFRKRRVGQVHPFPVTVAFLGDGLAKLRASEGGGPDGHTQIDLWRGLKNVVTTDEFMKHGGTELAPMSSTSDLKVALAYSAGEHAVLLKLRTDSFMSRGSRVRFLSAYPREEEGKIHVTPRIPPLPLL